MLAKRAIATKAYEGTTPDTDFPVIRHSMYCAEQIIIPQPFPHILKAYAKAVIRTQPYDLLRWSAAYFRCLAAQVTPPVKRRLEPDHRFGTLTRGYLRTLRDQLGRGFFVDRTVLQSHWISLSLPEDELLSFLSVCRMLHWPQVHWLKLFAVMVGSLNGCLLDTLTMICELLTDDVEGSPAPIPMWMLRECYVFLAELDCGNAQRFVDGRKVVADDELEEPTLMPNLPQLLSLQAFRNAIVEKFNQRLGVEHCLSRNEFPYRLDAPNSDGSAKPTPTTDAYNDTASDSAAHHPSPVSSNFRFIGDFADDAQLLGRTPDFDSVILLLHEAQGCAPLRYRDGGGPGAITEGTRRHALRREQEQSDRGQRQAQRVHDKTAQITQLEHDQLMRDVQPPWSWMHQFAAANCRSKAYNFLECQSMASSADRTPSPDSSDESFDFERGRFHAIGTDDATAAANAARQAELEAMLLGAERPADGVVSSERADVNISDLESIGTSERIVDLRTLLDDLLVMLEEAVDRKEIELGDTHSVATFVLDNELAVGLNLAAVRVALRHADEQGLVFADFDEMRAYVESALSLSDDTKMAGAKTGVSHGMPIGSVSLTTFDLAPEEKEEKSKPMSIVSPVPADSGTVDTNIHEFDDSRKPLVDNFADCQLDEVTEEGFSSKPAGLPVAPMQILGLIGTPPSTPIVVPTPPQTPTPTPSTPHNTSSGIISANVSLDSFGTSLATVPDAPAEEVAVPEPFVCEVAALPGIGATSSVMTVRNFVTYMTGRARDERSGLAYPRHFREPACPHMVDTLEN